MVGPQADDFGDSDQNHTDSHAPKGSLLALCAGTVGVVFGDIGTSPIYAFKECFAPGHGAPVSASNVLGVVSLILWSLLLIVTVKYLVYVLRADN